MVRFQDIFPAEIVSVQEKPYLFSNLRVDRDTIPEQFEAYDVADDCDGEFWRIQRSVMVNHWGTIIGLEEVELTDGAYYPDPHPDDDLVSSEGWFTGDCAENQEEFIADYDEFKEACAGSPPFIEGVSPARLALFVDAFDVRYDELKQDGETPEPESDVYSVFRTFTEDPKNRSFFEEACYETGRTFKTPIEQVAFVDALYEAEILKE